MRSLIMFNPDVKSVSVTCYKLDENGKSKNEIFSCSVGYFNNPEEYQKRAYDDVYVIAAKFSKSE